MGDLLDRLLGIDPSNENSETAVERYRRLDPPKPTFDAQYYACPECGTDLRGEDLYTDETCTETVGDEAVVFIDGEFVPAFCLKCPECEAVYGHGAPEEDSDNE